MKATPVIMDRGKEVLEFAGRVAGGDTGEQFHILLQAVALFAAKYEAAPKLIEIAIDTLSAVHEACEAHAKEQRT